MERLSRNFISKEQQGWERQWELERKMENMRDKINELVDFATEMEEIKKWKKILDEKLIPAMKLTIREGKLKK